MVVVVLEGLVGDGLSGWRGMLCGWGMRCRIYGSRGSSYRISPLHPKNTQLGIRDLPGHHSDLYCDGYDIKCEGGGGDSNGGGGSIAVTTTPPPQSWNV